LEKSDYDLSARVNGQVKELSTKNWPAIARLISTAENHPEVFDNIAAEIHKKAEANRRRSSASPVRVVQARAAWWMS